MRLLGGATYMVSIIKVGRYGSLLWTGHGVVIAIGLKERW